MGFEIWIVVVCINFFVLLVLIGIINGSATITSFNCFPSESLCLNMTCNTTVSRDNNHQLNCGCFIPHPLYQATLEVRLLRKRGGKYVTLITINEDLKNIIKQSVSSPAMARLFSASKKYLQGFEYPFQGNMSVRKMPVLLNYASVFMQSSTYRLLMKFATKEEVILRTELDFIIGDSKNRGKPNNKPKHFT
ncbi:uncharacterized protein LOC129951572 [Eupeodes corollae]|uniref:uncharacterized protein LOC129951572 n=1 Tax=Eupeodes corollae TaxID=290404 RepID=UPI00248FED23|nr:uncharacterized protein LOC129951572 [Eupeodes corollae]